VTLREWSGLVAGIFFVSLPGPVIVRYVWSLSDAQTVLPPPDWWWGSAPFWLRFVRGIPSLLLVALFVTIALLLKALGAQLLTTVAWSLACAGTVLWVVVMAINHPQLVVPPAFRRT